MKTFRKFLIFLLIIVFGFSLGATAEATTKTSTVEKTSPMVKIFYFRDNPKARASLFTHPKSIDVLAPQAYSIDNGGLLSGAIDPAILTFAQAHNIKVMPLVTNKSFSRGMAEAVLNDPSKQDTAINALVLEAQNKNYWGWQIDFEGMSSADKDRFSSFIEKAGPVFKTHNLVFSVAVIAQTSSNPADYPNNLWDRVIGAYDYDPIASSSDFVSVMSYDDPDSKGPVSPYPWLREVIDYSLQFIPADKLSLGIPFYDWKWNDTSGKLIAIRGYTEIEKILMKKHRTLGYSATEQTPFIKYTERKNHYTLWYENGKSIAKKISLIEQYKLQGFSAWALGLENPSVYSAF